MLFHPSKRCKCVHNQVARKREKLSGGLKLLADEKTHTGGAESLPPLRFWIVAEYRITIKVVPKVPYTFRGCSLIDTYNFVEMIQGLHLDIKL